MRAHRFAPPQRLATALDKYDLWVTLAVDEGRGGRPEPPRVSSCAHPAHLSAHTAVDRQVADKLACSGAVRIRRRCLHSRCRSGGASRLRGAQKRDFAAPQRAAHRTQSPAFWSERRLLVPTRREQKFALWPAPLERSSLRFPFFLRRRGHTRTPLRSGTRRLATRWTTRYRTHCQVCSSDTSLI